MRNYDPSTYACFGFDKEKVIIEQFQIERKEIERYFPNLRIDQAVEEYAKAKFLEILDEKEKQIQSSKESS